MSKVVSQAIPLQLDELNAELTKRSEEALVRVHQVHWQAFIPISEACPDPNVPLTIVFFIVAFCQFVAWSVDLPILVRDRSSKLHLLSDTIPVGWPVAFVVGLGDLRQHNFGPNIIHAA